MANCPVCNTALRTVRQRDGIFFYCHNCSGRAVTVPQVRRVAGDRFATQLLRQINSASHASQRTCPFCERFMRQFQIPSPQLTLDSCRTCGAVWFDAAEFEKVPESGIEPVHELEIRGREALAVYQAKQLAEQARDADPTPDETWKWVPALLGMPVELESSTLTRRPWVTWSLSLIIAIVSLASFSNLKSIIQDFGFIPAEFWRYGGATLITSFFLHGGLLHLIGNLYFFMLVGDNVEDFLGHWRFGLLILVAAVTGDVAHFLGDPQATVPCVGASGGIAGEMAFYALKFPRSRLGFFVRFGWFQLPAWGAFALWTLLQFVGVIQQLSGFSNVSALAHLGGVAVGVGTWLRWRRYSRYSPPA